MVGVGLCEAALSTSDLLKHFSDVCIMGVIFLFLAEM